MKYIFIYIYIHSKIKKTNSVIKKEYTILNQYNTNLYFKEENKNNLQWLAAAKFALIRDARLHLGN